MTGKDAIVRELGVDSLLLPEFVGRALVANDRVKYLFTLLQEARGHAERPDAPYSDLREERLRCMEDDGALDEVVAGTRRLAPGRYSVPGVASLQAAVVDGIAEMLRPLEAAPGIDGLDGFDGLAGSAPSLRARFERLASAACAADGDVIEGSAIDAMTRATRGEQDSLHLVVMDAHKELNRLQTSLAEDMVGGAFAYGLTGRDRELVSAFMRGINRTAPLKFDHPGLGATATRVGERLVLQNDIGTTDAHVLVVHVAGRSVDITYTDVHFERARFFRSMFEGYDVRWEDVRSRSSTALEESDDYFLCSGHFEAAGDAELEGYLEHVGSRLVFLIDWNKARKRLRHFVSRCDALALLRWAANKNVGQRGFLQLGGERLIHDSIERTRLPIRYGQRLDAVLGRDAALGFLRFVLRTCAEGLLAGRSEGLVRDEVRAELSSCFLAARDDLHAMAADHAALIAELAASVRNGLLAAAGGADAGELRRNAKRARGWEQRADEILRGVRTLSRRSYAPGSEVYGEMLERADDAADGLEEAAFLLTLLPDMQHGDPVLEALCTLGALVVEAAREFVKCVENAAFVQHGMDRGDVHDFLEAVDRLVLLEHQTDDAERDLTTRLVAAGLDAPSLHVVSRVGGCLEESVDTLLLSGALLRDHLLDQRAQI